jgi:hypothetical protein
MEELKNHDTSKKVRFSDETDLHEIDSREIDSHAVISDSAASSNSEDFMVELINNYTSYFKKIYGKTEKYTLLDGIDTSDDTSTNKALEEFFEELCKFKVNDMTNPNSTKIVKYSELDSLDKSDELYAILESGEPLCASISFFAILIELTNLKIENKEKVYEIISLK